MLVLTTATNLRGSNINEKENDCLSVDFAGEDMGILIGKRGQTLDSLQYLTSLVVNKEQQDYVIEKVIETVK